MCSLYKLPNYDGALLYQPIANSPGKAKGNFFHFEEIRIKATIIAKEILLYP